MVKYYIFVTINSRSFQNHSKQGIIKFDLEKTNKNQKSTSVYMVTELKFNRHVTLLKYPQTQQRITFSLPSLCLSLSDTCACTCG